MWCFTTANNGMPSLIETIAQNLCKLTSGITAAIEACNDH